MLMVAFGVLGYTLVVVAVVVVVVVVVVAADTQNGYLTMKCTNVP